jgi:hypothetical protein
MVGLKSPAVVRRFTHNDSLIQTSRDAVDWTFTYHGSPSGSVLADEIQRDLSSYMGSELCTAVETAYSLAYLYHSLGVNEHADRAERTIFNAVPVMLTDDHWAHQYMDQPNGPWTNTSWNGTIYGPPVFTTANIGVATTWGLEPQYPCCTVNHPQGYPKFLSHSWATLGDSGLVHALLSPSTVTTNLPSGGAVTVQCDTAYPFGSTLTYTVDAKSEFSLYVRVPSWSSNFNITVNGAKTDKSPSLGLLQISLPSGHSTVVFNVEAKLRTEARQNGAISIYVGNILFALDIGQTNTSSLPHRFTSESGEPMSGLPLQELRDYYMENTQDWAVAVDPSTLVYHPPESAPQAPFSHGVDAGYITVSGCSIQWPLYLNATPDVVPTNPACRGKQLSYRLIPYGQAKVHMAELPVVHLSTA